MQEIHKGILEPSLPIIDPHHHLWHWQLPRPPFGTGEGASEDPLLKYVQDGLNEKPSYLLEDMATDASRGHDIRGTVFIEAGAMYRQSGPVSFRSIGEVEFAAGAAAMAESGAFGNAKICAGIVGFVDLRLADAAEEVLAAHVRAGGGRYRGVRNAVGARNAVEEADDSYLLRDRRFRRGFSLLSQMDLVFDSFLRTHQIPELTDLARSFPETQIVLNHAGLAATAGLNGKLHFEDWRSAMSTLSNCANVAVKIGGLGGGEAGTKATTFETLAKLWRPYVVTCIELFGANRCMFESDYPASAGVADYPTIWNAFKHVVLDATTEEKAALFAGTAGRIYRLEV